MFADLANKAISRASQLKARRSAPLSNGGLNGHNGASIPVHKGEDKQRRSVVAALLKSPVTVWVVAATSVVVMSLYYFTPLGWMWKNQYLYFQCPEKPFWQRAPDRRILNLKFAGGNPHTPRLHYISAKFDVGPDEKTTPDAIMKSHSRKIKQSGVFSDPANLHFYSKFPDWILKDKTWIKHLEYRNKTRPASSKGSGYWFWKPLLIDHHLHSKAVRDGDFVIFSDSDRVDFLSWIGLLIETMIIQKADLAVEQMSFLERQWTKGDAYKYFCQISGPPSDDREDGKTAPETKFLYPDEDTSRQYNASFIVVRRNSRILQFVGAWLWATRDYNMLSDEVSKNPNAKDFTEHRHDQSFLSLVLKCRHREPAKTLFPHTCLRDWKLYTFQIDQ